MSGDDDQGRTRGRAFPVAVAVDVVITAIAHGDLRVLLGQRRKSPYRGRWALPGGAVGERESLEAAAGRLFTEFTGLPAPRHLEQVGAYGSPDRDPERRVVSIAFWAVAWPPPDEELLAGWDEQVGAGYREMVPAPEIESGRIELAFDHQGIVGDALELLRSSLESRAIAGHFCPPEFTISQLREVYEAAWGTQLDPGNFQRKARRERLARRVAPDRRASGRRGRPAQLWQKPPSALAEPDVLRKPFPPEWRWEEE